MPKPTQNTVKTTPGTSLTLPFVLFEASDDSSYITLSPAVGQHQCACVCPCLLYVLYAVTLNITRTQNCLTTNCIF